MGRMRSIEASAALGLGLMIGVAACSLSQPQDTIVLSSANKSSEQAPQLSRECSNQGIFPASLITERPLGLALGRVTVDRLSGVYSMAIDSEAFYGNIEEPGESFGSPLSIRIGRGTSIDLTLRPDGRKITDRHHGYLVGLMTKCNVLITTWLGGRLQRVVWNSTEQKINR